MGNQLLLIEDVDDLGRSGDVVSVKPGFARNFLLPQKKAVVADTYTLRLQAKLKAEREERAKVDRADAEAMASKIEGLVLSVEVKVDPDGHMYGSVAALDIVRLLENEGHQVERKNVVLVHPIKTLGTHPIHLKLKEGIPALITLNIVSEGYVPPPVHEEPPQEEAPVQE
jgi:large subunit ribosomal protein L9